MSSDSLVLGRRSARWMDETDSHIPVDLEMARGQLWQEHSNGSEAGEFPFTRGNFPRGYRDRLWTFRRYSGFGTAEARGIQRAALCWAIQNDI